MRRIFALLAISLTAVVLVTVLTGGAASVGLSHSANSTIDDGSHAFSSALVPDLGPHEKWAARSLGRGIAFWARRACQPGRHDQCRDFLDRWGRPH